MKRLFYIQQEEVFRRLYELRSNYEIKENALTLVYFNKCEIIMPKVMINMKMPRSCAECPFAIQTDAKRFGYICQLNFTGVFTNETRPSWCLLKPVKE